MKSFSLLVLLVYEMTCVECSREILHVDISLKDQSKGTVDTEVKITFMWK